ncbi:MAG TPA: lipocalin-like domain-containing protein [Rhizomicrobium sp.]|jgi:hypothetical protein|nr:lipocalin-like domain-containing protein [Rhizomicrobium sp.]
MRLFRQIIIATLFLTGILVSGANAGEFDLTGTWTLQTMVFVEAATGKVTKDFGEHPKGYAIYAPGGYMSVVINAEGRQPIPSGSPDATSMRAKLLMTMTAHAGLYRLSNGVPKNQVEVAHDPAMVGRELVRYIKVIDKDHYVSTTLVTATADGRWLKTVLTWQRAG